MMDTERTACPRCGDRLTDNLLDGLCARCLGALNFDTLTQVTRVEGTAGRDHQVPTVEELADFFPQLEILSLIGRGGMGVVYKARQKSLHRFVALKLLAPERAGDPSFARRFASEARSLAALNHPHIVAVHDFGEAGGYFYLLMEFVDGVNLRQLMQSRRFSSDEALGIISPVCDALQAAHECGIIHRDVKPENLLIDRNGMVKIADFGISRMIHDTVESPVFGRADADVASQTLAAGTPDYAAPEQGASGASDHRVDIYSLGVVLYEMITGERPDRELIIPPSRRTSIDMRIDDVVLKALQKEPDLRFRTMDEFRRTLDEASGTKLAPDVLPVRKRRATALILSVAVMILALAAWLFWGNYAGSENSYQPQITKEPELKFQSLEDAYQAFEENFTELQEARKVRVVGKADGSAPPADLQKKIEKLEARDHQLRAAIAKMADRTGK
ncbi:serine/threonine protein kinase [Luteolibacter pohnpeiensis]|uniref:Serine/threonine protein kinase n=1 Tax=Luteolibacter pohnpeiensis TaxID=454153 RepID=A0A934S3Q9_9BACT|nr:serine/threonine-protein kinase [Luteolibacter pohnpeiensis]MBK1881936.1 serine/threonine protein kinase [Luteolibacter pohnpeiensis]